MDVKQFTSELAPQLSTAFNVISMISGFIVVMLFSMVAYLKPNLVNRVTLRLQVGISLFDMSIHLFALFHQIKNSTDSFCTFIGFYRSFGNQVYCFLNLCIALNLQLIFLHNLTPTRRWEIGYWSATLLVAAIANFIPLGAGYFGKNADGLCFISSTLPYGDTVLGVNINGVSIVTFLYCLLISILVVFKLIKNMNSLDTVSLMLTTNDETNNKPKLVKQIKMLALRISIYPILCFLCLSGFNARFFVRVGGGNSNTVGLIAWSLVGLTTAGFFNLIAFLFDPTFQTAVKAIYREKFIKDVNFKVQHIESFNVDEQESFELKNQSNTTKIITNEDGSSTVITTANTHDLVDSNYGELVKFL